MIYLASPYTHPDPDVRKLRVQQTQLYTAARLVDGLTIFSPILYGKLFESVIGGNFLDWRMFNHDMIQRCSTVWILKLDGWAESAGIADEIAFADEICKPVVYKEFLRG